MQYLLWNNCKTTAIYNFFSRFYISVDRTFCWHFQWVCEECYFSKTISIRMTSVPDMLKSVIVVCTNEKREKRNRRLQISISTPSRNRYWRTTLKKLNSTFKEILIVGYPRQTYSVTLHSWVFSFLFSRAPYERLI